MVANDKIKDWVEKYEQYKLLLKDIEHRKLQEKKERLIKARDAELKGENLRPIPVRMMTRGASIQLPDENKRNSKNLGVSLTLKKKPRLSSSMTMEIPANV